MDNSVTARLDGAAVFFSAVCLVHCLLLPVAVTLMPIVGTAFLSHSAFHQLMLLAVLPTSLFSLTLGCRRHRSGAVAWLGGLGLAMLVVAAFAVESAWGANAERAITVAGGLILALAHIQNFRLCRHQRCQHHHGQSGLQANG